MHENKVQTCLALSVKKLETKLVLVRPKVRNILKVEINIEIGTVVLIGTFMGTFLSEPTIFNSNPNLGSTALVYPWV